MKTNRSEPVNTSIWISLFVMSLSVVAFEIHLMHFFSIVQWQHFASMVISIALLGFGTSGTLLSLFREKMLERSSLLIPFFMMTSGLLMMVALPLSRLEFFRLDTYTLFTDPSQLVKLTLNYLLFFLPFLFAALSIGLVFVKKASKIGYYYFADLLGAGFGGLLAILLMWSLQLGSISLIISILPLCAGLLNLKITRRKEYIVLLSYSAGCLFFLIFLWNQPLSLKASPYKSISYALDLPDARIEGEKHSPYGYLQVVSSPVQRFAPGLSLGSQIEVPASPVVFNNGNWYAPIPVSDKALQVLDHSTMGAPFRIREIRSMLQLGAGAGFEVRYALRNGVNQLDAVEPHAVLIDLLSETFASQTDSVYNDPRVRWHSISSRSFLEQIEAEYDLVQLPLLGTFGGSVGLNALEEDWVLTREGFRTLWNRLDKNGILAVSCWVDMPQKMSIRLGALLSDLLQQNQVSDPWNQLLVIRSWGTITFLLSKNPWTESELSNLDEFCRKQQFDQLSADADPISEPFNLIQDPYFETNLKQSIGPKRDSLLTHFPFHVKLPTDNKPYFFQFLKLSRWQEQKTRWGESRTALLELGYFLLVITFAQLLVFAFALVLLPLFKLKKAESGRGPILIYFSSLGVGYMFLEMVLIKYFALYLGHPIYSVSAVITVMLISSGLGSMYSEKLGLRGKPHVRILAIVSVLAVIYSLVLGPLLSGTVGLGLGAKLAITLFVIGIPAFFMGMPFPLGLKKLDATKKKAVPWAWGVNGFASVISVSLAVMFSVEFGFVIVLLLSALAYFLALLSVRTLT